MKNIILLLRPHQWLKNVFIFLPLFFGRHLTDTEYLIPSLLVFAAYCLAASSIYCFNDIWDVEADRLHPRKCKRPIASGAVSVTAGYITMFLTLGLSAAICYAGFDGTSFLKVAGIIAFYYIMNIAYCVKLKQISLIDVFVIAVGFVLRVLIGGFATGIWISHWIILMTFLLALFLAFAKRRDDVVIFEETGVRPRKNIGRYNIQFMNQAIAIIASVTMVCYIMYTVSDDVTERMNTSYLYVTSIWVLAGILRYLQLTIVDIKSGSPTKVLMKDRFTQLCIIGWLLTFMLIIYF